MAFDWLFGQRTHENSYGSLWVRSLILDVDTLLDVQALMNRRLPESPFGAQFSVAGTPNTQEPSREVSSSELRGLGQYERQRLFLEIRHEDGATGSHQVITSFSARNPTIHASPDLRSVRDEIARLLLAEGRPRVQWSRFRRLVTILPALILAGLFTWAEATTEMVPALHFLGWFAVLLVGIYGVRAYLVMNRVPAPVPGHLIRPESRADTAARRADTKRDFRVAILTFIPSILLALATAWLTNFFGFGS